MNRLHVRRNVRILVAATQENDAGGDLRGIWDALRLGKLSRFLEGIDQQGLFHSLVTGPGLPKASWGPALRGEIMSAPGFAGQGIAICFSVAARKPNCGPYESFDCVNFL